MVKVDVDAINKDVLDSIVYRIVGRKTTYLGQLDKAGKRLFGRKFHGVYSSDRIPKLTEFKPYCILNLDKTGEPGSHWVGVVKFGDKVMLYDSFGRSGKRIIPNLLKSGNGRIVNTELDAEQNVIEEDCGARSLSFIYIYDKYGASVAKKL